MLYYCTFIHQHKLLMLYCILLYIPFPWRVCFTCSTWVVLVEDFFHGTGCCAWQSWALSSSGFQLLPSCLFLTVSLRASFSSVSSSTPLPKLNVPKQRGFSFEVSKIDSAFCSMCFRCKMEYSFFFSRSSWFKVLSSSFHSAALLVDQIFSLLSHQSVSTR